MYNIHTVKIMILSLVMTIIEPMVSVLKNTAEQLTGIAKRKFMGEAVNSLGKGGQRAAARHGTGVRPARHSGTSPVLASSNT